MLLSQRLFAALLTTTTVATVIVVNISPSYGQAAGRALRILQNGAKKSAPIIRRGSNIYDKYKTGEELRNRLNNTTPQCPQQRQSLLERQYQPFTQQTCSQQYAPQNRQMTPIEEYKSLIRLRDELR